MRKGWKKENIWGEKTVKTFVVEKYLDWVNETDKIEELWLENGELGEVLDAAPLKIYPNTRLLSSEFS